MACHFPGADNTDKFWRNLVSHKDVFRTLSAEEAVAQGADPEQVSSAGYVRRVGYPDNYKAFDTGYFGFTPSQALITDPQHRLLLITAQEALDNAGVDPERVESQVGVFVSLNQSSYLMQNILPNHELMSRTSAQKIMYGNDKGFAAAQISYKLNLTGPSMAIDTTCSSSL